MFLRVGVGQMGLFERWFSTRVPGRGPVGKGVATAIWLVVLAVVQTGSLIRADAQGVFTVSQLLATAGATGNTACLDDPPGSGNFFTHVEFAGSGFIPSNEPCTSGAAVGGGANAIGLVGEQVANIRHFLMGSFVETSDMFDVLSGSGLTGPFIFALANFPRQNGIEEAPVIGDLNPGGDDIGDVLPPQTEGQGVPGNFPEIDLVAPVPASVARRLNELRRMEKQLAELLAGIEKVQTTAREQNRELTETENLLLLDLSVKAGNLRIAIETEKSFLRLSGFGNQIANYRTRNIRSTGTPFAALFNTGASGDSPLDSDRLRRRIPGRPSLPRFGYAREPIGGGNEVSRWDFGFYGTAATFDDNQAADRNGDIGMLTGRATYLLSRDIVIGGGLSYKNGQVNSAALNSALRSNFVGARLFARARLGGGFLLDGVAGYEHGFNRLTVAGAAGRFESNAFNIGARLSRRFPFKSGWWIEPNAALTYSTLHNAAYTDGAGTVVAGSSYETATGRIGAKLGKILDIDVNGIAAGQISTGVEGIFNFSSEGDLAVGNGIVASNPANGVRVEGGFDLMFNNGWRSSASIAYMHLDQLDSFTGSLALKIPLN